MKVEIYINKEINEEIVEWFDDETNKNAFYIQSFHSNDQREYLKETDHFKQYTVFDAVQSPTLSSPPCEIGRISVFEFPLSKNFM